MWKCKDCGGKVNLNFKFDMLGMLIPVYTCECCDNESEDAKDIVE